MARPKDLIADASGAKGASVEPRLSKGKAEKTPGVPQPIQKTVSQAPWRRGSWSYRLRHTLRLWRSGGRSLWASISQPLNSQTQDLQIYFGQVTRGVRAGRP